MWSDELETRWRALAEEVLLGMKEWRLQHPKATFGAIEQALDEGWAKARARILADAALTSAAADPTQVRAEERPRCGQCGALLEVRGQETRHLTTTYDQDIALRRSYVVCPACREGFFPPG